MAQVLGKSGQGFGFQEDQGAGCRVQGARCRMQGTGCRVRDTGCRVQGAGFRADLRSTAASSASGRPMNTNSPVSLDPAFGFCRRLKFLADII